MPQLATTHFASTSIDGFSKNHPHSLLPSFCETITSALVDVPRAADTSNLRTCHRHPPTVPCLPSGPPNLCEPHLRSIGRFDQFHRRGTILTFLWQYSTRQAVPLQTMRLRPEYGHQPKTPPSPAVEGKRHSHPLPSTTESREFRSQLGVHASSWETRASFYRLAKRLGDRPPNTLHRPFSPSDPWRTCASFSRLDTRG